MEIIQIILMILLILLLIAIVAVILILFYPFKLRIKADKGEKIYTKASLGWFCRIFYASYTYKDDDGKFNIYICGVPLYFGKKEKIKKVKSKEKDTPKEAKKSKRKVKFKKGSENFKIVRDFIKNKIELVLSKIRKSTDLIEKIKKYKYKKEIFYTVKDILSAFKFKKFDVYLNYGDDDPYNTGITTAFVAVVNEFIPMKIRFKPDFEKSVLICNGNLVVKFTIWQIGFPIIKFLLKTGGIK